MLAAVLLLGLALRARLAQDACLHQWDERFHALVAKHVMDHPLKPTLYDTPLLGYDYKRWDANYVWLHKQPLPLWLMAASYSAFGINEFATRVPSLLFSLLAIYITYLLGRYLFNKKSGLLAAFFMAINGLVIELGSGRIATDHYDTLFMAFIELAILCAWINAGSSLKRYAISSGLCMGMAMLTKWLPCLIILPVHYFFLLHYGATRKQIMQQLGLSFITCLLLSAPWQVYILLNYPLEAKWEYYHNWLHIATELDGHKDDGYLYYLDKIRINYSEIVYIPIVFAVYRLFKSRYKNYKLWALLIWIFVPILFFSLAKTKMQGYILFICPALFVITAGFFFVVKDRLGKTSAIWQRTCLILFLALMIALPSRYCFERTAFGTEPPLHNAYTNRYKALKGKFPERSVVMNVQHPIELMFYTDCVAYYNAKLSVQDSLMLTQKGYSVFYLGE